MEINKIYNEDCLGGLKKIDECSVDCCITSPPYWGLRDYGVEGQLGLEKSPEEYVKNIVEIFREIRRALKTTGTLWLNLGDSYAGSGKGAWDNKNGGQKEVYIPNSNSPQTLIPKIPVGLKAKDLVGIPWMVAFALRADGWYLRQDIIWNKPNPMPESVIDRCTKSHEYIFLLSKSAKYFYDNDAIKKPMKASSYTRLSQNIDNQVGSEVPGKTNGLMKAKGGIVGGKKHKNMEYNGQQNHGFHKTSSNGKEWQPKMGGSGVYDSKGNLIGGGMVNKRSVWTVTTKGYKEAHFATFPENLIVDCVKAGCREGGIVLDPFMGAGTTALVARKFNRNYIGFELNEKYIKIAEKRLRDHLGLFI